MKLRRNVFDLSQVFAELFAKVSPDEIRRNPRLIAKTKAIIKLLGKCVTPQRTPPIKEATSTTDGMDGHDESKSNK